MKIRVTAAGLLLLSACAVNEDEARSRYEKILWEHDARVKGPADAQEFIDRLAAAPELTLDDCYPMAIRRSESLAINGEQLVQIQAQYEQALAGVFPSVTFKGSYTRQDDLPSRVTGGGGSFGSSFNLSERKEAKIVARQPIFSGLKEFHALTAATAFYESKEHDLRHARLLLYGDVADAFYTVLQAGRDIETTQDSLKLAEERLEELVQRNRAQISRRSEVLAQEAEVASTRARLENLKGTRAVAWDALKFLTGLAGERALNDASPDPGPLDPVETYVERAVLAREDLRSLQKQIEAADAQLGVAQAGYMPTVVAEPTYYLHREGVSDGIDWDFVLSLEVPIFEGGRTSAKMTEAESQIRVARFQLSRTMRDITLQISRAHADLLSLQDERAALEKAVASTEENYEIVQAEYRQGIVTNIEVLNSFNTLQRAKLDRDRARFQAKLAFVRLAVQSGVLPGEMK